MAGRERPEKAEIPHLFSEDEIFAFAGLYSHWQDPATNNHTGTYSIITTRANELMSEIHNNKQRMPVILHHRDYDKWLQGAAHKDFAFPYEVKLKAQKV